MALLERAQIELNDITDSAPAIFTLSASQPKVQIEKDGSYSPNYTLKNPQVITPTLYIGNTNVTNSITNIYYSGYTGELEEESKNFKITTNLTDSVVITATIKDFTYNNINYGVLTAQIELTKLSSTSNQYTAFISSTGSIFTPSKRDDITLTASLYLGASEVLDEKKKYQWYQNGAQITKNGTGSSYKVTVGDVNSMSNYHCEITLDDKTYPTSSITIMDKTDPYSAQIISSSGLIFTSNTESTTLTCKVYQSNVEITNNITYKWYKISTNGRTEVPNETKSVSITADLSEQSVTYYCEATINGTTTALAQISLMTAPKFNTVISPKQIFLPFKGEVYQGGDSYILTFYLTAANGSKIDPTKYSIAEIKLGTKSNEYFKASSKVSGEDTIITINRKEEIKSFPDSEICSISYTYMKVTFEEEFYFVKNISGENGEEGKKGEDGNGIKDIEISYARSNDGTRPPKDNVEGVETNWYPSIDKIPAKDSNLQFLWEKKVTRFTNTTETTTEYSVSNNGREIEKIVEYYTLGLYANKTGVYVKEVKYNENGIRDSVILEDGQEKFIFDENGNLLLNENGDIVNKYNKDEVVFPSSGFETASFARLYEGAEWSDVVPTSSQITEPETEISQEVLVKIRPGLVFLPVTESVIDSSKNSLWIKYHMIYINGTFGETVPTPLEEMNGLRLSASMAETIYNNDSIQSIVQTTNWGSDENGMPYTLATYITQMPDSILTKVISQEQFARYFNMDEDGLTIGKEGSHFVTFTNEEGFYIKFISEPYSPDEVQDSKTIGAFDTEGLNVSQIILQDNLNNVGTTLQSRIVLKGTNTGGWSWVERRR